MAEPAARPPRQPRHRQDRWRARQHPDPGRAASRPTAGSAGPVQGPTRAARRARRVGASYLGTSHRQEPVRSQVGRVRAGLAELFSPARGLRGRARQRRHDRVLGHRDVRPDPRASRSTCRSASSASKFAKASAAAPFLAEPTVIESAPGSHPQPRRRGRRRRLRAHPQRDLHRRGRAGPPGARRRPGALMLVRRDLRAPAGCPSTSARPTSTTSRRRSASPPTAACGSR